MAQIFSALFFVLAATGAAILIVGLLRSEWNRIGAILAGEELGHARAFASPRLRIRVRASAAPARRPVQPLCAAA